MRNRFDIKTQNLIVWNGEVVMSRTEAPFFSMLFEKIADLRPSVILEVGFGLGISARLIQKHFRPMHHDIVEVDSSIFKDLRAFAARRKGVTPIRGDFWTFRPKRRYDFIFFDTFEYATEGEESDEDIPMWARRMRRLLVPNGVVCVPVFNVDSKPVTKVSGFKRLRYEEISVPSYKLENGRLTDKGIFECWQLRPPRKSGQRQQKALRA